MERTMWKTTRTVVVVDLKESFLLSCLLIWLKSHTVVWLCCKSCPSCDNLFIIRP